MPYLLQRPSSLRLGGLLVLEKNANKVRAAGTAVILFLFDHLILAGKQPCAHRVTARQPSVGLAGKSAFGTLKIRM